jgi:hypothetical protein
LTQPKTFVAFGVAMAADPAIEDGLRLVEAASLLCMQSAEKIVIFTTGQELTKRLSSVSR